MSVTCELPLVLSPSLTIVDLGTVDNRPAFRNDRYAYPIGFKSERVYPSYVNPGHYTIYTSEITEMNNEPLFMVSAQDDPDNEIFHSRAPSGCWVSVVHRIRGNGSVSGPEQFGLADKRVRQLIDSGAVCVHKKRTHDQVDQTQPDSPIKEGPITPPQFKRRKITVERRIEKPDNETDESDEHDDDENDTNTSDEEVESDHPDLPLAVSNGITVLNLGHVEHERAAFHSKLYIYTIGFKSQKRHFSYRQPDTYTVYTSTVRDGGDGPLFVVTVEDDPGVEYVAHSPTTCWMEPAQKVNRLRGTKTAISGPHFFGFTDYTIKALIESLPGAIQCTNYNRKGAATGKHGIAAKMGVKFAQTNRTRRIGLIVPIEKTPTVEEATTPEMLVLRAMPELPQVFYVSTILRKKLGLPCFSCRQLERLIITPTQVTCRLFLTVAGESDWDKEDWQTSTEWVPESVEWEGAENFKEMSVATRLKVLSKLFDWRMYNDREVMVYIRKMEENATRIDPLGKDRDGNTYYHFGDERIYKQDTEKQWSIVVTDNGAKIAELADTFDDESEEELQKALKEI